jgi:hypothetical protein
LRKQFCRGAYSGYVGKESLNRREMRLPDLNPTTDMRARRDSTWSRTMLCTCQTGAQWYTTAVHNAAENRQHSVRRDPKIAKLKLQTVSLLCEADDCVVSKQPESFAKAPFLVPITQGCAPEGNWYLLRNRDWPVRQRSSAQPSVLHLAMYLLFE